MQNLPDLPLQYNTWKEFWNSLSPAIKDPESKIRYVKIITQQGPMETNIEEYAISQIKEGVFREAVAEPKPDDFTYDELRLLRSELHDLNVYDGRVEFRKSALEKIQLKLDKIVYPER